MKCPQCGEIIEDDSLFCEYCGAKVGPVVFPTTSVPPKEKRNTLLIIAIILLIAVLCLLCLLLLRKPQVQIVERNGQTEGKEQVVSDTVEYETNEVITVDIPQQLQPQSEETNIQQSPSPKTETKSQPKTDTKKESKSNTKPEREEEDEDVIFVVVEENPEFPGGQQALLKYLRENVQYPVIAQQNGIQGRVVCQFVVNKNGDIVDVEVIRSSGEESLDKEAVRVIRSMPRWKPGLQRGQAVRVRFTIPINFRLE